MNIHEMYLQAYEQYEAKNYGAALELVEEMKRLAPDYRAAYLLEIRLLDKMENYPRLIAAVKKFLPSMNFLSVAEKNLASDLLNLLAHAQSYLAMPKAALNNSRLAAQMSKDNLDAAQRHASAIYYATCEENFSATDFRIFYAEFQKYLADITPYPKKFYEHEKIRVGFLSADFHSHPVMNWAWALIRKLDKKFFTTYCYSSVGKPDVVTEHVKATVENWRDISSLDDAQAAELIRNDETDILFDMSGHTSGNRLRVAAYCPATVQISGIGYMNSTGLECFDYFLTDETCAGDEKYFTEKFIRLPSSHFCYEPSKSPEIFESPCLKTGYVTFGCFNQYRKITDSMLTAWKKILDVVPDSRLILKNGVLNNDDGKNFVGNRLKSVGIDTSRVEMRGFTTNHPADYNDMDIALDTFPYTGCVTTCEALYMGVPVVSLYSDKMGTRVGLSILKNIGLEVLATDSYNGYVNRAIMLASDWNALKILRKNLRGMMTKSPLMDSENYIREVEEAFIKILRDAR